MSAPAAAGGTPLSDKSDLVAYLEAGCKPPEAWSIGTEHEKLVFRRDDLRRPTYDGPRGIEDVLHSLQRFGWDPAEENGKIIALRRADGSTITLEPGGQLELSGAMLRTIHQTCAEIHKHLDQLRRVGDDLGVGLLGVGFDPKWGRDEVPMMPRERHHLMRERMKTQGTLGEDMMIRTCTVQVNLDYSSEADMVRKLRVSLALQPISVAVFANSPFAEGRPTGYLSYRAHVWTDTDPERCGPLEFGFDDGMGFERYTDYALDVPLYFVYREGRYIDARGQSFRDFLAGKLPALPGERPTSSDWANHLTTLFPDVRLKTYLEQRGADGGPWQRLCALPALWVGLLYDSESLDAAWQLVKDWTSETRASLRDQVPERGLRAEVTLGGHRLSVNDIARQVLAISRGGLERRQRTDSRSRSEALYLDPLDEIVARKRSPAEDMLECFHGKWQGDIDRMYEQLAY